MLLPPILLLALLPSLAPLHPGTATPGVASAIEEGGGNVRFGPNWAVGTHLSYAHIVAVRTLFHAGPAPLPSGRVRRFAVWPGLATAGATHVIQAYAAQSEEDYFDKE
jgi:hypothetical protein